MSHHQVGLPPQAVLNSDKCFLKLGPDSHVDDEVGGGVDGERQVGDDHHPVDPGRQVQPALRRRPREKDKSILYFRNF